MTYTRRSFLSTLAGLSPLLAAAGCAASGLGRRHTRVSAPRTQPGAPAVTNHNTDGAAVVVEGTVLPVTLKFAGRVGGLTGGLPVRIEPESEGGEQLVEPQPTYFYAGADGRTFFALLSAPLDLVPGAYVLRTRAETEAGAAEFELPYAARRGDYRQRFLTLSRAFSEPAAEVARRTRLEFEQMVSLYARRTPPRWRGPFADPIPGASGDNFGDRRTVNRTKHYRHAGLDYRAAPGTPVRAVNDGEVVLSAEHWVPGQVICLDHGGGVFSRYMHLSRRDAAEGDVVRKGEVIGLSGSSGGQKPPPHLHLDLVVNGTRVGPKQFMSAAELLLKVSSGLWPADRRGA